MLSVLASLAKSTSSGLLTLKCIKRLYEGFMGQNYTVKKFKADWGFFNLDTSFSHEHVSVPPGAHRWNDTVGRSLTGCLDTVARRFNSFSDGAWRSIERRQVI